jgi:hypothetical protein
VLRIAQGLSKALREVGLMDKQKQQKILLAVVCVLALGAGSFFFLTRDSGPTVQNTAKSGPTVRKAREVKADADTKRSGRKVRDKKKATKAKVTTGRKERAERETKKKSTRKARGRKSKKVKKASISPVG